MIFTAQYRWKMYNVKFKNYDGSTLYTTQVERGHDAIYAGEVPTKNDGSNLNWIFTGWSSSLECIKKEKTFVAQFYAPNLIKCTFKNYDGTILLTQYIGNGDKVVYEGEEPTKPEVNNDGTILKYEFSGWDKSLKNIENDTEFIAQYGCITCYEVKFVNYDDSLLYKTKIFSGGTATYDAATPNKPQEAVGYDVTEYTFKDWDKSLRNITEPTTFKATYSSASYIGYLVKFLDDNNRELYSHYYRQGTTASYPYSCSDFYHYDSNNVNIFIGWSKSLENISNNLSVNPKYLTLSRKQNGEYPQSEVKDEQLISYLNELNTTNTKGYYEYGNEQYEKSKGKYYKVEPIQWRCLSNEENKYFLITEKILDFQWYDKNGSNNYKNSSIRSWLNNEFIGKAFTDDSLILTTEVDNSAMSTGFDQNPYACENTFDKIFLLSIDELFNTNYGFIEDNSRLCEVTEYSRSVDTYDIDNILEFYWTRSPYNEASDIAIGLISDKGNAVGIANVNYSCGGIRPGLFIKNPIQS